MVLSVSDMALHDMSVYMYMYIGIHVQGPVPSVPDSHLWQTAVDAHYNQLRSLTYFSITQTSVRKELFCMLVGLIKY